jgi:hypothetical protein
METIVKTLLNVHDIIVKKTKQKLFRLDLKYTFYTENTSTTTHLQ